MAAVPFSHQHFFRLGQGRRHHDAPINACWLDARSGVNWDAAFVEFVEDVLSGTPAPDR